MKSTVKSITLELTEGNARYTLHALRELESQCRKVIDDENADEDEQADCAEDIMQISLVYDKLEKLAVKEFGEGVLVCSHDTL
ncbi:MAG: hypothetical protein OEZ39_08070 [Gammaproteobacteria bacterium]|nr:hypothetical protein [Gammaproteobacteria bacterium]MDH5651817.1 hypothetical protein [Gammaproteobacteria bacterium]